MSGGPREGPREWKKGEDMALMVRRGWEARKEHLPAQVKRFECSVGRITSMETATSDEHFYQALGTVPRPLCMCPLSLNLLMRVMGW